MSVGWRMLRRRLFDIVDMGGLTGEAGRIGKTSRRSQAVAFFAQKAKREGGAFQRRIPHEKRKIDKNRAPIIRNVRSLSPAWSEFFQPARTSASASHRWPTLPSLTPHIFARPPPAR